MKKLTLFVCLLLSLPAIAQDTMTMPDGTVMPAALVGGQYRFNESYYLVDNTTNCQTYNCLIITNTGSGGGTVSFVQISSGLDGSVYAFDGAGNVWTLPFSTTSKALWTKIPAMTFTGMKGIAVRSSSEIYALVPAGGCAGPNYQLAKWNGANWVYIGGCLRELSISEDNQLVGIGTDGGVWYTTNPYTTTNNPTWVRATNVLTWSHVASVNGGRAFANIGTTLYSINIPAQTYTVVSGAPAISNTPFNMACSPDGFLYFRSNVATSKGNFYAYSLQNGVFYNMLGTITMLGGNIRDALFAQNGSTLYHYLNTAVGHNSTVQGNYDCGTTGCPAGSVHTATASGLFLHGLAGPSYNSVSGAPATTLTASYNDISEACDPMFGDPTSTECYISQTKTTINNQVKCSVMGMIYSAALATPSLIKWEWAYTRVYSLLSYTGCQTDKLGVERCSYNVDNWCANTATPDLDMHNQTVTELTGAWKYWELKARCVNFLGTGWECSHAAGPGVGGVLPPAPNCTYNP